VELLVRLPSKDTVITSTVPIKNIGVDGVGVNIGVEGYTAYGYRVEVLVTEPGGAA
jgi:hypothetical protein